jgi:transcriptional regulator with XRE-family HTH domain
MTALGDFLRARRAALTPAEAGLPAVGRPRRVPGLRREEVAQLAGVSVDHYTRLEQGRVTTASESLLGAVARALRMTDAERDYLVALAGRAPRREVATPAVAAPVRELLAAMTVPGLVLGPRTDVLAWNPQAAALFTDFAAVPPGRRYLAWLVFRDEAVRSRFADWPAVARDVVARLRMAAARLPADRRLAALVGELSVRDDDFRRWWGELAVRAMDGGRKRMRHPVVGDLDIDWQALAVAGNPDQTLVAYTAPAGSASADALRLLASWGADAPRLRAPGGGTASATGAG